MILALWKARGHVINAISLIRQGTPVEDLNADNIQAALLYGWFVRFAGCQGAFLDISKHVRNYLLPF